MVRRILLINPPTMKIAPPAEAKFRGFFAALKDQYPPMNTGLLSIASDIVYNNPDASLALIDGVSQENYYVLIKEELKKGVDIVGMGIPSGYEYLEALDIADYVFSVDSKVPIVFGGQHVVSLRNSVFKHSKSVSAVCVSQGESVFRDFNSGKMLEDIEGIITRNNPGKDSGFSNKLRLDELGPLRHELFPNYLSYWPYAEDSRGCQHHCFYCINDLMGGKIDIRGVDSFAKDIDHAVSLYGKERMYAVLASNFGVDVSNTLEKAKILSSYGITWTTELRMDSKWEKYLDRLFNSGLRIVTSGMESANSDVLRAMKKTGNPEAYVRKASEFIKAVDKYPELVFKISYMIYVGETKKTLNDTLKFIEAHKSGIDSVLLTPTFVIEGSRLMNSLRDSQYVQKTGFEFIEDAYWNSRGVYFGRLSREIGYEEALELRKRVEEVHSNSRALSYYLRNAKCSVDEGARNLSKMRF